MRNRGATDLAAVKTWNAGNKDRQTGLQAAGVERRQPQEEVLRGGGIGGGIRRRTGAGVRCATRPVHTQSNS